MYRVLLDMGEKIDYGVFEHKERAVDAVINCLYDLDEIDAEGEAKARDIFERHDVYNINCVTKIAIKEC
jgi:hypothetical protein